MQLRSDDLAGRHLHLQSNRHLQSSWQPKCIARQLSELLLWHEGDQLRLQPHLMVVLEILLLLLLLPLELKVVEVAVGQLFDLIRVEVAVGLQRGETNGIDVVP